MGKGQELLDAAREGDRKTVEKILAQITKRSGPFTSLRRGAGVNVQDDNGYTPLHHACLRGHKEIVRLLLSVDASPCVVDKKGATALHLAAWKGDSDVVSMLLQHPSPAVNIDQLTSEQETALLIAAQFGNVAVVAQLLARGADVAARNIKDESALDLAAQYGRLETVQHLLRARPQLVDPYRFPVCRGRLFSSTPLHRASKNGHKEVVSTLIAAGMDPNVRTYSGTALHEAANYGKASVVRILLAKGADLSAADRRGNTVHDLLNEYSEEATRRVRRIIREHMATNGYESEEDLPPFPVQDYSPTGYPSAAAMKPSELKTDSMSPSPSFLKTQHPQSFVRKLATKLGIKTKFSSAPNISNTDGSESDVSLRPKINQKRSSTNTVLIGNSRFFKKLSKKEESGDIVCNDEFDTISLDRLATLDRTAVVNRSNRSCPGFKTSLPNISENNELSDSNESLSSVVITEVDCENNNHDKVTNTVEAVNRGPRLSIFEPRDTDDESFKESTVNEYYESYEVKKEETQVIIEKVDIPKPPPRPTVERKLSNEDVIYENIAVVNAVVPPKPAARKITPKEEVKIVYENVIPKPELRKAPEPPKRTMVAICTEPEVVNVESSANTSRTSTMSTDSMIDETNLEDIFLSKKSKSFKMTKPEYDETKAKVQRSDSESSDSSNYTEASAIDNIDVSDEIDKTMYLSMTGTMPHKKPEPVVKKKVLFRHKTFTNMEMDRNSISKDFPKWNNEFLKETLAHYHIRGTGHCIYKAPTVQEFIYIFNRDTLYRDVAPFDKVPNNKRESYFETGICFCKPAPPKHHNSAEDLLEIDPLTETITIDFEALRNRKEMLATSFKCFCDSGDCTFHAKTRDKPVNFVVKFSAIKKSISTPDITLDRSPSSSTIGTGLSKISSVPLILEEPYAVVSLEDIMAREKTEDSDPNACKSVSQPSTISTSSRPYSIKDISDVISVKESPDTSLTLSSPSVTQLRKSTSSEYSGKWSLQSCNSNVTVKSDMSYKTCLEESDSSDDGTLHSDSDSGSDTDTVKTDVSGAKRPWVHSDSFRFNGKEETMESIKESRESGIELCEASPDSLSSESVSTVDGLVASLERDAGGVRSGRRRWEGGSEGDALSVSSAASSCAAHHLAHQHEYNKVSPTPPKKPPRRNLSVSPTHANSPSSGYSYELRAHARSQDDLDDIQSSKQYLKHGRSVDQYVDSKLSYSEYEENHNSPRVPQPNPRPSLKNRSQPVAITAMYENVAIKEQNPRRKLRRNPENFDPMDRLRSTVERSSLESLLDDSPDGEFRVDVPLSPSHYKAPPTPDHPPPSAKQAERSIHERIRPLSQEYKRRSALRDSYTEVEASLLRAASAASVASGATDRSTDAVEEYVCDVPFAGLFKGSTTTLDGIGLRPVPAERPKTLRKLKSVYDTSPTDQAPQSNGVNGVDEDVRKRSNTTSSSHSGDKSLSILSPFDEQEEWAKISEIMASFGSKLVRESVFVSELEQEFTSRLGLSCSESSLGSTGTSLGSWLAGLHAQDLEQILVDAGFDDVEFINGVIEESDLREMGIDETEQRRILEASKQLPLKIAEISNNYDNNNISKHQNENVDEWLRNINLEQYSETFRRHLYVDMERVRRIWDVELTAVLEIHKVGHRKRILASVSGQQNGPSSHLEDINADLNDLKSNIQQLREDIKDRLPENLKAVPPPVVPSLAPPGGETLKRSKKNRPAPQPPRPSDLEIRAPSELLVGVPGALKTTWKHQPFVLVTGAVTYVANYLGSTVVKELRGTESTKKSIQKLKKSTKEPRDSPDIILSISYRGVKFLNTITRELVCEHEVRNIHCACQDADDLTHFAYITKDHDTKSHFCHVFRVATMEQATEVILTLGEAFEVAYQMALREQSLKPKIQQAKTPTHDPTTTSKEKPNLNHGRSHSITEIKLNGHQLKIAPMTISISNEDFQRTEGSRSPRTSILKAPIASTEEL